MTTIFYSVQAKTKNPGGFRQSPQASASYFVRKTSVSAAWKQVGYLDTSGRCQKIKSHKSFGLEKRLCE
ncbi:MAG TPA: hypothetical protein DEB70_02485 [Planctomycetaceae bacterium]|nr:hypothetical protein [Planctomycetaceae bacterium]